MIKPRKRRLGRNEVRSWRRFVAAVQHPRVAIEDWQTFHGPDAARPLRNARQYLRRVSAEICRATDAPHISGFKEFVRELIGG